MMVRVQTKSYKCRMGSVIFYCKSMKEVKELKEQAKELALPFKRG